MALTSRTQDQSQFIENQEMLQPPPEVEAELHPNAEMLAKQRQRRKLVMGILILIGVLIGLMVLAVKLPRRSTVEPEITPTPTIQTTPSTTTSELDRLEALVDQADPESEAFPPPQVDMKMDF